MPSAATVERAVRWFQSCFWMQDWVFDVDVSGQPPSWVDEEDRKESPSGLVVYVIAEKSARIWLNTGRIRAVQDPPLVVLFHELAHVWAADTGIPAAIHNTKRAEAAWNCLGTVLAAAFTTGLKPPSRRIRKE